MTRQLIIGLVAEGTTDYRFLTNIIRRTYEDLAFECQGDVEILEIQELNIKKSKVESYFAEAAIEAYKEFGVMVLCIHKDADAPTDDIVFQNSINPGIEAIAGSTEDLCRNIVPIVPIQETESWMLADKPVFKEEIGSTSSDAELNIQMNPESITDPKQRIEEAIRITIDSLPRKRRTLRISELYQPLGQKVGMSELSRLSSFQKFQNAARQSLVELNYLIE